MQISLRLLGSLEICKVCLGRILQTYLCTFVSILPSSLKHRLTTQPVESTVKKCGKNYFFPTQILAFLWLFHHLLLGLPAGVKLSRTPSSTDESQHVQQSLQELQAYLSYVVQATLLLQKKIIILLLNFHHLQAVTGVILQV